jgi:hypothetical protein
MPTQKTDTEERLRFRSTLAAIAGAIVDHRLLLHVALVLVAIGALRTWGPDEVRDGIDAVLKSAPIRQVSRGMSGAWGLVVDGLQAVDRATRRAGLIPRVEDMPAASITPSLRTHDSAAAPAANSPPAPAFSQRPPVNDPLQAVRIAASPSGPPPNLSGIADDADTDPPDAVLWSLEKDGDTMRAEMHDRGAPGVDLQLFRNGQLWRGERWADRAVARTEAQAKRVDFEKRGWTRKLPPSRPDLAK